MDMLITLGHNASAILVDGDKIVNGYEEERLTRIKGDSHFPINAIQKLECDITDLSTIYISHWFNDFNLDNYDNKYFDKAFMIAFCKKYEAVTVSLNKGFTHHDGHALALEAFLNTHMKDHKDFHLIVADGFGNNEEVFSVYKGSENGLQKIHKCSGYKNSLGLMYQYATSFTGMKENQDEYKFLGYESLIDNVTDHKNIMNYCETKVDELFTSIIDDTKDIISEKTVFPIDLAKLESVKSSWYEYFQTILDEANYDAEADENNFNKRVIIGYAIQYIIQEVILTLINYFDIKNVGLNGGIFYNVKLNNTIMNNVEKVCIMPIAGDQGCAIGLYCQATGISLDLKDICIGKRQLEEVPIDLENVHYFKTKEDLVNKCVELLKNDEIPQILLGDMEYGPRALCHTSSLCKPTQANVSFINRANDRNEIMPCAPVILDRNIDYFFYKEQYEKVIGSDQYMILTYDYKIPFSDEYSGVMHKYPHSDFYSGRPQMISDETSTIGMILDEMDKIDVKALVNTSLNFHGKPILFSVEDGINDLTMQLENSDQSERLHLLVGLYDEK